MFGKLAFPCVSQLDRLFFCFVLFPHLDSKLRKNLVLRCLDGQIFEGLTLRQEGARVEPLSEDFFLLEPLNSLVTWKVIFKAEMIVLLKMIFSKGSLIQFEIVCLVRMVFRPSKHTCSILVLGDTLRRAFSHVAGPGLSMWGLYPPLSIDMAMDQYIYIYIYICVYIYIYA